MEVVQDKGIAVDLDETLSWTIYFWMIEGQKLFGNPENLGVEEMARKYRYTSNVTYWQSEEFEKWRMEIIHSNETQRKLPVLQGAKQGVHNLNKIIPIVAYLSCRPVSVTKGTKDWLKKNGFPDAQLILRPSNVKKQDEQQWKAKKLESLYPRIVGMVDDNISFINELSNYKGVVFLFDHIKKPDTKLNVIPCTDWSAVVEEARHIFWNKFI